VEPATQQDFEAAELFLRLNPSIEQRLREVVLNASAVNICTEPTKNPNAGGASKLEEWRRFERNLLSKSALIANDAPKHNGAYDQRMQLHAGTVNLINLAKDCLKDRDYDGVQSALDTLHRRETFNLTCYQHVGNTPGAGFQAAYELWHNKHASFNSPDFDPAHLDKSAADAALSGLKQQRGAANNRSGANWSGNRRSLERGRSPPPKHRRR